jgi:hypothetical protein
MKDGIGQKEDKTIVIKYEPTQQVDLELGRQMDRSKLKKEWGEGNGLD